MSKRIAFIGVRLDEELRRRLDAAAERNGLDLSTVVRAALEDAHPPAPPPATTRRRAR